MRTKRDRDPLLCRLFGVRTLKRRPRFGDGPGVTVPRDHQIIAKRCDVILERDGALRLVIAGDWTAPSERGVIEQVFSDLRALQVPVKVDFGALGRASPEISAMVRSFGAQVAL